MPNMRGTSISIGLLLSMTDERSIIMSGSIRLTAVRLDQLIHTLTLLIVLRGLLVSIFLNNPQLINAHCHQNDTEKAQYG